MIDDLRNVAHPVKPEVFQHDPEQLRLRPPEIVRLGGGVDHLTGSLAQGKMADVVVWNRDPFSIYAQAEQVFVDGALVFDRNAPATWSDFEVGTGIEGVTP